jgi:hypothetical protein
MAFKNTFIGSMTFLDCLLNFSIRNETNVFEINQFFDYLNENQTQKLNYLFSLNTLYESIRPTRNFFKIIGSKIEILKQVK